MQNETDRSLEVELLGIGTPEPTDDRGRRAVRDWARKTKPLKGFNPRVEFHIWFSDEALDYLLGWGWHRHMTHVSAKDNWCIFDLELQRACQLTKSLVGYGFPILAGEIEKVCEKVYPYTWQVLREANR